MMVFNPLVFSNLHAHPNRRRQVGQPPPMAWVGSASILRYLHRITTSLIGIVHANRRSNILLNNSSESRTAELIISQASTFYTVIPTNGHNQTFG